MSYRQIFEQIVPLKLLYDILKLIYNNNAVNYIITLSLDWERILLLPLCQFPQCYEDVPNSQWGWGCTFRRLLLRSTIHMVFTAWSFEFTWQTM